ncbi:hypothetical protein MAR_010643 [Mya arenaria]|uniref:Uncharacterized protein n=1 Tax=Mya arenaria TaxID=6604 RepID=A0ABY7FUV2_MYAAR|nr:hypothetical protein MAR_010643 [Mya arenaria]
MYAKDKPERVTENVQFSYNAAVMAVVTCLLLVMCAVVIVCVLVNNQRNAGDVTRTKPMKVRRPRKGILKKKPQHEVKPPDEQPTRTCCGAIATGSSIRPGRAEPQQFGSDASVERPECFPIRRGGGRLPGVPPAPRQGRLEKGR